MRQPLKTKPFKIVHWLLSPQGRGWVRGCGDGSPMPSFTAHGPHPNPLPEGEGAIPVTLKQLPLTTSPFKVVHWLLSPLGRGWVRGYGNGSLMPSFAAHGPHPNPLPEGEGAMQGQTFSTIGVSA